MISNLKLYLHVGDAKTGTSLVQNFCDVNRSKLFSDFGFLYPNFMSKNLSLGRCQNHAGWFKSNAENEDLLINEFQRLFNFSRIHSIDKILLSNEGWLGFYSDVFLSMIQKVVTSFSAVELIVICYLRRIDTWVESAWKQWGLKKYSRITDFYQQPICQDRFKLIFNHLVSWADLIGKANIIIRPYEQQQLADGLIPDFLRQLSLDFQGYPWRETEITHRATNIGFDKAVIEVLNQCQPLFSHIHDNSLFRTFTELLGDSFQKGPFQSYGLLSPEQKTALIRRNQPFEAKIAKRFMDRSDGNIFWDPFPDPNQPSEQIENISLEDFIPIVIKMIDQNYQDLLEIEKDIVLAESKSRDNND